MSLGLALDTRCSWGKLTFLQLPVLSAWCCGTHRPGQRCQRPSDPTGASTLGPWHCLGNAVMAEFWGAGSSSQGCAMVLDPWGHGGQGKAQGTGRTRVLSCWFSSQKGRRVSERARRVQPCL